MGAAEEPDEWRPITVGEIVYGATVESWRVSDATRDALMIVASETAKPSIFDADFDTEHEASVNAVFEVPGPFGRSNSDDIYIARWFKKGRTVRVGVPVSDDIMEADPGDIRRFVAHAIEQAVETAADYLSGKRGRLTLNRARAMAAAISEQLLVNPTDKGEG